MDGGELFVGGHVGRGAEQVVNGVVIGEIAARQQGPPTRWQTRKALGGVSHGPTRGERHGPSAGSSTWGAQKCDLGNGARCGSKVDPEAGTVEISATVTTYGIEERPG